MARSQTPFGALGVDADAVADAELDLMAVEHRHFLLFGERRPDRSCRGLVCVGWLWKIGLAVGRLDDQFGLEEPGRVPQLLRVPPGR